MKTILLFCLLSTQLLAAQTFTAFWTPPLGVGDTNQYIYTLWIGTSSGSYNVNYATGNTNQQVPMSVLAPFPQKNFIVVSAVSSSQSATNSDGSFNLYEPSAEIIVYRRAGQILKVK